MSKYNNYINSLVVVIVIISFLLPQKEYAEGYQAHNIFGDNVGPKIQCSNGSRVDFVSDCPVDEKCLSLKISDRNILQCIPSLPLDNVSGKIDKLG